MAVDGEGRFPKAEKALRDALSIREAFGGTNWNGLVPIVRSCSEEVSSGVVSSTPRFDQLLGQPDSSTFLHGVICRIVCQRMSTNFVLQFEDFQSIRSGFTGDLRTCLTDSDVSVWRGRGQRELSVLGEAMCEYTSEACVF
jgi:hypothetical protein